MIIQQGEIELIKYAIMLKDRKKIRKYQNKGVVSKGRSIKTKKLLVDNKNGYRHYLVTHRSPVFTFFA